ncbi:uncharacterized protein CLUP02_10068 [Colletotrichum lupini]|uniref:Uncharacterized protein n=1 Tax=Colletotrichum lupini TaxID=145971 RepID=A0A9Q8SVZ8_9PEZI|nr:uncharacterized protein CLUP02_10068 [Colletotrichum lupini]UQC84571.1 hypothetical protein CLUP02_10068 [Colletotrichum lupini]
MLHFSTSLLSADRQSPLSLSIPSDWKNQKASCFYYLLSNLFICLTSRLESLRKGTSLIDEVIEIASPRTEHRHWTIMYHIFQRSNSALSRWASHTEYSVSYAFPSTLVTNNVRTKRRQFPTYVEGKFADLFFRYAISFLPFRAYNMLMQLSLDLSAISIVSLEAIVFLLPNKQETPAPAGKKRASHGSSSTTTHPVAPAIPAHPAAILPQELAILRDMAQTPNLHFASPSTRLLRHPPSYLTAR